MPLHPDARPILELMRQTFPDLGGEVTDAAEARRIRASGAGKAAVQEVAKVVDRTIPGPDGTAIPVRIYWPDNDGEPLPVTVYFHGGGWVFGDLDSHDGAARGLANGIGTVVVSVDYRLAPEHRFPAAVDDAYAATEWAAGHAAELGGDPSRLVVAGDSAGGNLAAAITLLARDRGGPDLAFQLLIYPVTDHDFTTQSYVDSNQDCLLITRHMQWFWDQYAPEAADRDNPAASPLRARELSGLPPAHVLTAGMDPLHVEGARYAQRLTDAGVPTTTQHCPGLFHGFIGVADQLPVAGAAMAELCRTVRAALG